MRKRIHSKKNKMKRDLIVLTTCQLRQKVLFLLVCSHSLGYSEAFKWKVEFALSYKSIRPPARIIEFLPDMSHFFLLKCLCLPFRCVSSVPYILLYSSFDLLPPAALSEGRSAKSHSNPEEMKLSEQCRVPPGSERLFSTPYKKNHVMFFFSFSLNTHMCTSPTCMSHHLIFTFKGFNPW